MKADGRNVRQIHSVFIVFKKNKNKKNWKKNLKKIKKDLKKIKKNNKI